MALREYFLSLLLAAGVALAPLTSQAAVIPCDYFDPEDPFCQAECDFDPSLPWCEVVGNSNVAFIPGLEGSRLYRQNGLGNEDELWVPTTNQDAEQLYMNDAGQSIDPNIYTRDIIDRTKYLFPIYEDFINFMDTDMVGGGIIHEWRPLPYDWRLSVDQAAALPSMKQNIEELANSSDSGKVTIIAHSNGGLVAKLLLNDTDVASK